MIREIIQIGDSKLLQKSEGIDLKSPQEKQLAKEIIQDLIDTCEHHKGAAAGLSAVQIGVLKRICIVKDLSKKDLEEIDTAKWKALINPVLVKESREASMEWEGCMSINSNKQRIFGPVWRSKNIEIEYYDEEFKLQTLKASEFYSHLIQHELDHMDGVLFLQYVENPENLWKEEELDKYIEKNNAFPSVK